MSICMYKNSTVTVIYFHYFFTWSLTRQIAISEKNIGHQNVRAHGMFCSQEYKPNPTLTPLESDPHFKYKMRKSNPKHIPKHSGGVCPQTPLGGDMLCAPPYPPLLQNPAWHPGSPLTTSNLSQALKSWDFIRGGFRVSIFTCFDVFFFAAFVLEAPRTGGNFCGSKNTT